MTPFYGDIQQQPHSLRRLITFYTENQEQLIPAANEKAPAPLLTGMGASFHAALVAAFHLNQLGIEATAVEATDLLFYGSTLRARRPQLIFVSQSGASVEIDPLTANLAAGATLLAVTNDTDSLLAGRADAVFPIRWPVKPTLIHWRLSGFWPGGGGALRTAVNDQFCTGSPTAVRNSSPRPSRSLPAGSTKWTRRRPSSLSVMAPTPLPPIRQP